MIVCHFCETTVESAYFKNTAEGLTKNGDEVILLDLGEAKPPVWLPEIAGASYFNLGVTSQLAYPIAILRLFRFLRRERVDILQTHLFYAGLIGVISKFVGGKSFVALTRHHTSVIRMLGRKPHILADKWMAEMADAVVTVSEAARDYMTSVDGIRRNDIEVVYLGFDFEKFKPDDEARTQVRKEFGVSDNELVIGYVANFPPGKGHLQLLEAFGNFVSDFPNSKLLLVGDGDRSAINERIDRFELGETVLLAGWRNDTAACLNAMDIFVQPSLSEAFSQVLVEALGVGLPVIATKVGGAAEVIIDGDNGLLIEPDDVDEIVDKLRVLQMDASMRHTLGKRGRESVRERFSIQRMVDRQIALYQSWLSHK